MGKRIYLALVIAGLCFGQMIEPSLNHKSSQWDNRTMSNLKMQSLQSKEDSVPETIKSTFNRNLSIEVFGGINLTFNHNIRYNNVLLPEYMWNGGCEISYQFTPHIAISGRSGYSYTRDLVYKVHPIGEHEMKFSHRNFSFLFSYKDTSYTIGSGINISHIMVLYKWWDMNYTLRSTTIRTATYVTPMVSASAQWNIIYSLYGKIQIASQILQFMKFGSKEIDMPKIQPSIGIGLGYKFNF